ncbi:unnamed protein product, partial [Vitis vinifera]
MERLIYSYSPIPSKVRLKPFSPLSPIPSLPPFDSSRLCFSSFSCTHLKRLNASTPHSSFLCSLAPLLASSSSSSAFQAESPDESVSPPSSLPQIVAGASQQRKAATAGTITLLSALTILLIHPVLAQPAFATFQTAAKTGGPAAATVGGQLIRTELLSSAWTGFFAGCLHTLSGPDHLAALAPLSVGRSRMESAAVGALWGCGHDAGQMIFGLLFLLLKDRLHIEVIRTWGTRVVGFTLLVIGAMGIREASEVPTPCVAVENGECDVGTYEALENPTAKKKKIGFATFATGIVHGLQPDALMMVLPALALPSRLAGSCSQALKERVPRITEKLTWASSLIAIALGFAILISQFFGFSLY